MFAALVYALPCYWTAVLCVTLEGKLKIIELYILTVVLQIP